MEDKKTNKIQEYINEKLINKNKLSKIIIIDPHKLVSNSDDYLNNFTDSNGYIVIFAATNLVFRELLYHAKKDEKQKIILIDQTPQGRKTRTVNKAPPLFYPDLVYNITIDSIIDLNLQKILVELTGDLSWPASANDRIYGKIIQQNIENIIVAHQNLRKIDSKRFSDEDFLKIIVFSVLGIPQSTFTQLNPRDIWRIALSQHESFRELDIIAPDIKKIIDQEIAKAEKPFCWIIEDDPDKFLKGFYTSLVLSQHTRDWGILLANIDPSITRYQEVSTESLTRYASEIIKTNPAQADEDLKKVEDYFSSDALKIIINHLKMSEYEGYKSIIQKEKYSTLLKSLAIINALRDVLNDKITDSQSKLVHSLLIEPGDVTKYVDTRESEILEKLKYIFIKTYEIKNIKRELNSYLKTLKVKNINSIKLEELHEKWCDVSKIEYYSSNLVRQFDNVYDLLSKISPNMPEQFNKILPEIKNSVFSIPDKIDEDLIELNKIYQQVVKINYVRSISTESELVFSNQFIQKCVKPNWDPEKEKAVILIFDAMRYDIWNELLKPLILSKMNITAEYKALSLLPTETHISRKALSASSFPDEFDNTKSENELLQNALKRIFRYNNPIAKIEPEGFGIGETVRYSGNNLEVYIFEFCDRAIHNIPTKIVNEKFIPSRPLSLLYDEISNLLENEVLSIIRQIPQDAKVFITSDHGFRRIYGEKKIWFDSEDLNSERDCNYFNCKLKTPLNSTRIPSYLSKEIISFTPKELRLPEKETFTDRATRVTIEKTYSEIIFPRMDYIFGRPQSKFEPYSWIHGGISLQEMIVPMIVLTVKDLEKEQLEIRYDSNKEFIESPSINLSTKLLFKSKSFKDVKIDIQAYLNSQISRDNIGSRIIFLKTYQEEPLTFEYKLEPEKITNEERSTGEIKKQFVITAKYYDGAKEITKNDITDIKIKLNPERIVRRVGNLGNIIGLSSQRGEKVT
jgi:hypothetical protein